MISTQVRPPHQHPVPAFFKFVGSAVGNFARSTAMRFSGAIAYPWFAVAGRSRYNYGAVVGDGLGNSIVVSVLLWICRAFPEAPCQVVHVNNDGTADVIQGHPMTALLERPNEFYSGPLMWAALLLDYLRGNAYAIKIRSGAGKPVELWYVPSSQIDPKWPQDGSKFISHYEYNPEPGRTPIKYAVQDVIHLRNGLDPRNPRKGLGVLGSLLAEIFTDDEASAFTAALLRNLGVPGVMLSPGDPDATISQPDADAMKEKYEEAFQGDNRGRTIVMSAKMTAQVLSFSPEQLDLKNNRRLPEERVCAVLGISPMVVGLGAGLEHSTYSNYDEAKMAAWENCIVPIMRLIAAELRTQLLDDFENDPAITVRFDLSHVRALQPSISALFEQANMAVMGSWFTVAKALNHVGMPSTPEDDYYIRSMKVAAVPVGMMAQETVKETDTMKTLQHDLKQLTPSERMAVWRGLQNGHHPEAEIPEIEIPTT